MKIVEGPGFIHFLANIESITMADLSGYERQKQHDENIAKTVEDIMRMPREELTALVATLAKTIEEVTPAINELTDRLNEGDELTEEEMTALIGFQDTCRQAADFIILAKQGIMQQLTSQVDEIYYALKQEAQKGNPEAKKAFEKLQASKQKAIQTEMGDTNN